VPLTFFGAGKTIVGIEGEIVDPTSNSSLMKFKHARASGMGFFGGDYGKFFNDDVKWVGEDVGKMSGTSLAAKISESKGAAASRRGHGLRVRLCLHGDRPER
jgi:hypothetical protein